MFQNAFEDMKESAKVQHAEDKANFAAVTAESKARWEEPRAYAPSRNGQGRRAKKREEQIAEAEARTAAAQVRMRAARTEK